ncbi:MAG: prohibitin family protein, partial [Ignavibacteriaceae bacterium]
PRGITVEAAPLRQITLPARLTESIEEKLKAEQESQRMQFVLQRETQEAERKRIEAKGIADFQEIVSKGISEQLLKWKGIEATEKLAGSSNSKIVVIGSGKDGLPLILGNN